MTGPLGDIEELKAHLAAYTAEDIADDYDEMFWAVMQSVTIITTLPLAKMIEHCEAADAAGRRLHPPGFLDGDGARNIARQMMMLRRLRAIQEDLFRDGEKVNEVAYNRGGHARG
jgi:hypothetical protein